MSSDGLELLRVMDAGKLRSVCASLGLATYGTKEELIGRILADPAASGPSSQVRADRGRSRSAERGSARAPTGRPATENVPMDWSVRAVPLDSPTFPRRPVPADARRQRPQTQPRPRQTVVDASDELEAKYGLASSRPLAPRSASRPREPRPLDASAADLRVVELPRASPKSRPADASEIQLGERPRADDGGANQLVTRPAQALAVHRIQRERVERYIVEPPSPTVDDSWTTKPAGGRHSTAALCCSVALGSFFWLVGATRRFFNTAPIHLGLSIFGATMAFYGGHYFAACAATEAFRNLGGNAALDEARAILALWDSLALEQTTTEAARRTARMEAGTAAELTKDTAAPSSSTLLVQRTSELFRKLDKPVRVQRVVSLLVAGWLAAVVTLQWDFARKLAIGVGIGNFVASPLRLLFGRRLASQVFARPHRHWLGLIIETVTQAVGLVVAFTAPDAVAQVYTAIAGGLLCARGALSLALLAVASEADTACRPGGVCTRFTQSVGSVDESLLDEAVGFTIAIAGLIYQLLVGPALAFPAELLLAPLMWCDFLIARHREWLDILPIGRV